MASNIPDYGSINDNKDTLTSDDISKRTAARAEIAGQTLNRTIQFDADMRQAETAASFANSKSKHNMISREREAEMLAEESRNYNKAERQLAAIKGTKENIDSLLDRKENPVSPERIAPTIAEVYTVAERTGEPVPAADIPVDGKSLESFRDKYALYLSDNPPPFPESVKDKPKIVVKPSAPAAAKPAEAKAEAGKGHGKEQPEIDLHLGKWEEIKGLLQQYGKTSDGEPVEYKIIPMPHAGARDGQIILFKNLGADQQKLLDYVLEETGITYRKNGPEGMSSRNMDSQSIPERQRPLQLLWHEFTNNSEALENGGLKRGEKPGTTKNPDLYHVSLNDAAQPVQAGGESRALAVAAMLEELVELSKRNDGQARIQAKFAEAEDRKQDAIFADKENDILTNLQRVLRAAAPESLSPGKRRARMEKLLIDTAEGLRLEPHFTVLSEREGTRDWGAMEKYRKKSQEQGEKSVG